MILSVLRTFRSCFGVVITEKQYFWPFLGPKKGILALGEKKFDTFMLKCYIIVLIVNRNPLYSVFISIETFSDVINEV